MRRKIYYAWPAHLRSGNMALIEPKPMVGMVRVRVELAPIKRRKR